MAKSLSEEIIDAVSPMTDELTRRIYAHWSARAERLEAALKEAVNEVPLEMATRFDKLLGRASE